MSKEVRYGKDARESMIKGVDTLANAVKITLGPKGRNVFLDKEYGAPMIINDGVSIAKEIELKDPFENMGARVVMEVASNTNDAAGDGTTTATVLAQFMIHEGLRAVDRGSNAVLLREGINIASKAVAEKLLEHSHKVENSTDIASVATISSGSEEIGKYIADAMDKVGKDGVINVDESKGFDTSLEVVEGLKYDRGYVSPYMATNREKMETELDNPLILLTDHKITTIQEILPVLEQVVQSNKALLIVADEIENEVISTLIVNKLRGTFNVVATKAPGFGDNQKEMLQDIAIMTGSKCCSSDFNMELKDITINDLGTARKVIVAKDSTTIIDGNLDKEAQQERIIELKKRIEKSDSDYDKKRLNDRLARMTNGVAIIKVGATTDTELKERKLRIEDALNATKAAVAEGIVVGGGAALAEIQKELKGELKNDVLDVQKGINIVLESLTVPLYQIAENAGYDGKEIVEKQNQQKKDFGFNALTGQWVNMFKSGVVDPTKVTKSALLNAASIAGLFITTEAAVGIIKEVTPDPTAALNTGGMY